MLGVLGIPFELVVPEVEELTDGVPEEVVVENARRKAAAGLQGAAPAGQGAIALGVDTEVVIDGHSLGKAGGRDEARERAGVARTDVTFGELDRATLEAYLASGEWRDRAGAYAIQGLGSVLVERVDGDFSNVVGLPLRLLFELAPELLAAVGEGTAGRL
jgi:septum formation protein